MKQIYELGQKVWAFKQQGEGFVKDSGVIILAEINTSGYIQYKIKCMAELPTGELKDYAILANHASMAASEEEIDAKIKKYCAWSDAQKKDYEETFGAPEYDWKALDKAVRG